MPARERAVDRGSRLGRATVARLGQKLREARLDRSLSVDDVAAAVGISNAEVSRIERALSPRVPLITLSRIAAVVGLDLSARLYPGATPLRDAAHIELLGDFRAGLHESLRWAVEVPLPLPGDQRAWDATVSGDGWRLGVEAETLPRDVQALVRRLQLKARDGGVDGVLLVLRDTRRAREFLRDASDELAPMFPIPGRRAAELLLAGETPRGSAVITVARRHKATARRPAGGPRTLTDTNAIRPA
jgi:transcriptional regulator with XRE-family HTH domain